jgi:hypothetical protein
MNGIDIRIKQKDFNFVNLSSFLARIEAISHEALVSEFAPPCNTHKNSLISQ